MSEIGIVKVDELSKKWGCQQTRVYQLLESRGVNVYALIPRGFQLKVYCIPRLSNRHVEPVELDLTSCDVPICNAVVLSIPELRKIDIPGKNKIKISSLAQITDKEILHIINDHDLQYSLLLESIRKSNPRSENNCTFEFYLENDGSDIIFSLYEKEYVWVGESEASNATKEWSIFLSKFFPKEGMDDEYLESIKEWGNRFIACLNVAHEHYTSNEIVSEIEGDKELIANKVIENSRLLWFDSVLRGVRSPSIDARKYINAFLSPSKFDDSIRKTLRNLMDDEMAGKVGNKPLLLQYIEVIAMNKLKGNNDYIKQESIVGSVKKDLPSSGITIQRGISGAVLYEKSYVTLDE